MNTRVQLIHMFRRTASPLGIFDAIVPHHQRIFFSYGSQSVVLGSVNSCL